MKRKLTRLGGLLYSLFALCGACEGQPVFQNFDPKLPYGNYNAIDFDGDGLMDAMKNGPALYRNVNGAAFEQVTLPTLLAFPGATTNFWADVNGDGLIDFAVTVANDKNEPVIRICLQSADHHFSILETGIKGIIRGWCDMDNDGRLDFLVNDPAIATNASATASVYWNEGPGTYSRRDFAAGKISTCVDVDGDAHVDVVVFATGFSSAGPLYNFRQPMRIFRNDGGRNFTDTGIVDAFEYVSDFDGDGKLDFLGTLSWCYGDILPCDLETQISYNTGNFGFRNEIVATNRYYWVTQGVADYNGDGTPEWIFFDTDGGQAPRLILRTNSGFVESNAVFAAPNLMEFSVTTADFNNDGALDFLERGAFSDGSPAPIGLWRSPFTAAVSVPTPSNLVAQQVAPGRVNFAWDGPQNVSYNLRVGTTPGANEIFASTSRGDGKRLLPQIGNVWANHGWHLNRLPPGTYYWSVQAVDYGFRGSPFAPEMSFSISGGGTIPDAPTIGIADFLVTNEDIPLDASVLVGPVESLEGIVLTAEWTDFNLIPPGNITFSGVGANRRIHIVPAQDLSGLARVTIRATDLFERSVTASFNLTVLPVNDAPTISAIQDKVVDSTVSFISVPFHVNDVEVPVNLPTYPAFVVSATSSNPGFIPNSALSISPPTLKYPDQFNLNINFSNGKIGSTTITVFAVDGSVKSSQSFVLAVKPPVGNSNPYIFGDSGLGILPDLPASPLLAADFNNDGRMDLLAASGSNASVFFNATTNFIQGATAMANAGMIVAADFNQDNFADILSLTASGAFLYLNQAGTNFSTNLIAAIPAFQSGHIELGDLDNDGQLDIVAAGLLANENKATTRIFLNKNGAFNEVDSPFPTMAINLAFFDFDQDGTLDFIFCGPATNGIMRGAGNGTFVFQAGSELTTPASFLRLGDFDSDGVLDLWSGEVWYQFRNQAFIAVATNSVSAEFPKVALASDLDNDGQIDLVYSDGNSPPYFSMWRNAGQFRFQPLENPIPGAGAGSYLIGDFNGDGAADVVAPQRNGFGLMILTNGFARIDAQPGPPRNLRAERVADALKFSWDAPSDLDNAGGFTYNLRVGSTAGGYDIVSPLSLGNGKRLASSAGNVGYRTSVVLTNLSKAKYFWSIQAVDASLTAGSFAPEQSVGFELAGNQAPSVVVTPSEYVGSAEKAGILTVSLSDDTTAAADIQLRVFPLDFSLMTFSNIAVSGSTASRQISFRSVSNRVGHTELIVQAIDASGATTTTRVPVTMNPPNIPPTISTISDRTSAGPSDPVIVSFTISDADNSIDSLKVSVSSDRPDLLPSENFVLDGTGATRTLKVSEASAVAALVTVKVTVTDPTGASRTASFKINFSPVVATSLSAVFRSWSVEVDLAGDPNRQYVLEVSTDLANWSEAGTYSSPSGHMVVYVSFDGPESRYYRARAK